MEDEDSDWWSDLQTVSSFDNGITSSAPHNSDDEIQQFSPSSILVESLIGQLCKLIENEPNHQKQLYLKICKQLHQMKLIDGSYEMEEFESMRSHYQKALYHLVTVAKSSISPNKRSVVQRASSQLYFKDDNILEWSRYSTEFKEEGFIAHGGFGQVFRARHKLDGEIYAVKKIYLRYNNANGFMQSLTEVKMLAKLNHPNIVAYKAAWLEPMDSSQKNKHHFHDFNNLMIDSSSDSSGGIVFESTNLSDNDSAVDDDNLAIVKATNKIADWNCTTILGSQGWACLYIQMQLCQLTLRQWLDIRNHQMEPVSEATCLKLFKKIVQGVEFIHLQGIVHHDIKPSNIFVSRDLRQVQVGDFGLACSLMTHHNPEVSILTSDASSHGQHRPGVGVGTKLYAAPEQLNTVCTPKSDIYSLGIVLMELIQPFQTGMERSKVIGRLKTGHLPTDLANAFPTAVRIINQCIYHSPQKRPTSQDLLNVLEVEDGSSSAKIISEKDELIGRLLVEADERVREIEELKRRVSELLVNSPETETIQPSSFE